MQKDTNKKIALFDMDGTLTEPRKKINSETIYSLRQLSKYFDIGIVTGSDLDYVRQQLNFMFDVGGISLDKIRLFPCNGTKYYKWQNSNFKCMYESDMIKAIGRDNYKYIVQALFSYQILISAKHDLPYTGTFFHYRGSMLNWCPIGRQAGDDERRAWVEADQENSIRLSYIKIIEEMIDKKSLNISVTLGGSTSFDIFPEGWDKTYVTKHLDEYSEFFFVGDRCSPGGNDHELYELLKDEKNSQSYAVSSPSETVEIINKILKEQL